VCKWLDLAPGTVVHVPINHNEGNYICDERTLAKLREGGQIVLRYCEPDGSRAADGGENGSGSAPNGALDDIAGICNERGNVFGLMPHPERVTDGLSGAHATQGAAFFSAIVGYAKEVAGR
jgi:phosphoribosylformylglycinamidine synthase